MTGCGHVRPIATPPWLDCLGYPGLLTSILFFQPFLFAYAGWFLRKGEGGDYEVRCLDGWMMDATLIDGMSMIGSAGKHQARGPAGERESERASELN